MHNYKGLLIVNPETSVTQTQQGKTTLCDGTELRGLCRECRELCADCLQQYSRMS